MKVILSRKGFDTINGWIPNAILADGRFCPLPIPYRRGAPIRYRDLPAPPGLDSHYRNLADFVVAHGARWQCAKNQPPVRLTGDTIAHLDPDLVASTLPRLPGWKPLFGQAGHSLSHLDRQGVGEGDLVLFWGRFDWLIDVHGQEPHYDGRPFHTVYGWLQIGRVHRPPFDGLPDWARYHPHAVDQPEAPWSKTDNAIFQAADRLVIPGLDVDLPGAGIFPVFDPALRLTARDSSRITDWCLPPEFVDVLARGEPTHVGRRSWTIDEQGHVRVNVGGVWQEAVWDLDAAPSALPWISRIFGAPKHDCATPAAGTPIVTVLANTAASSRDGRGNAPWPAARTSQQTPAGKEDFEQMCPSQDLMAQFMAITAAATKPRRKEKRGTRAGRRGCRVLIISPSHGSADDRRRAWQSMREGGYVAVGYVHHDFTAVPDAQALGDVFAREIVHSSRRFALLPGEFDADRACGRIGEFLFGVDIDNLVLVKDGGQGILGAGRISSPYFYAHQRHPAKGQAPSCWEWYSHLRSVEWLSTTYMAADQFPAGMPLWSSRGTLNVYESTNAREWVRHYLEQVGLCDQAQ